MNTGILPFQKKKKLQAEPKKQVKAAMINCILLLPVRIQLKHMQP